MKKTHPLLFLCFIFSFLFFTSTAQQLEPPVNSGKVMSLSESLIETGDSLNIERAIREYLTVGENDTNYVVIQLELANLYENSNRDSLAILIADKMLERKSKYQQNFYAVKAICLDNLKRYTESISVYEEGMKQFPRNYYLPYDAGLCYAHQKKNKEAIEYFKKAIAINPFYPPAHQQLGRMAMLSGNTVQSMLSYQFYLLLHPTGKKQLETVVLLEKYLKGELEEKIEKAPLGNAEEDDFSDIASLIDAKVALKSGYKSKLKVQYDVVKQMQLLLEKIQYNKGDKGYWMQTYAPFYAELYKKDYLEPFLYYILSSIENPMVEKWLKKHDTEVNAMFNWAVTYLSAYLINMEEDMGGEKKKIKHYFSNNIPVAAGMLNQDNNEQGYWKYFFKNQLLASEGAFNNGVKEGLWKTYYEDGNIKEIMNYQNGKLNGEYTYFYKNGAPSTKVKYTADFYDGTLELYYATGQIKQSMEYKMGKQIGKEIYYNSNGSKKYEITVIDGHVQGEVKQYYPSGKLKEIVNFTDGKRNGKGTEYHENGNLYTEGNYLNGQNTGAWKYYYPSGKLRSSGTLNDKGKYTGIFTTFFESGEKDEEIIYNEKGKLIGYKQYSKKGILIQENVYKSEELKVIRSFNKKGELIKECERHGKTLDAINYYPNGNKQSEGKFVSDEREGEWKFYNSNGVLTSVSNYNEGKLQGKHYSYFENGKVKQESNYNNDQLDGLYTLHYINGQKESEGYYVQDQEQAYWYYYHENGSRSAIRYYLNGQLYGKQQYFAVNGKLKKDEYFYYGFINRMVTYDTLGKVIDDVELKWGSGDCQTHFANKKLRSKYSFKNGLLEGSYAWYYPNGQLESEGKFFNDERTGECISYFPDGKKSMVEHYVNGKREDALTQFNDKGIMITEQVYKADQLHGKCKYYYDNKQVSWEGNEIYGQVDGYSYLYDPSGELMIRRFSENGTLLYYQYKNKNGNFADSTLLTNETGKILAYYQNGQKSVEYELVKGQLSGKRMEYQANGKILEDKNYVDEQEDGVFKYYHSNGNLKSEENYLMGLKNGKHTHYHENGKIKSEEYFLNGSRHGTSKYFDESGKPVKTRIYYDNVMIEEF